MNNTVLKQDNIIANVVDILKFLGYKNEDLDKSEYDVTIPTKFEKQSIKPYEIITPTKTCPQIIADDRNCMFWTMLLTLHCVLNPHIKTIDEISTKLLKKYPDKDTLGKYMNEFKFQTYGMVYHYEKSKEGGIRDRDASKDHARSTRSECSRGSRCGHPTPQSVHGERRPA